MKRRKLILDICLTLLLGIQMAYSLISEVSHEITGLCMLALLVLHHILNRGFHRGLFRGRYTPYRAVLTAIDGLMLALFLTQGLSGLMMARHVRILNVSGANWARTAHLMGAYWGFALCGIHAGLHMTGLVRREGKRFWIPALIAGAYGAFAFVKRGLPQYMTLRQQFVFLDFGESLALFYLDCAAMLFTFMLLGCLARYGLQRIGRRKHA